ncbi:GTP pyrophosphokinase family protein [Psychromonas sp. GE-S-Ul-11]|uniref:GTP pyrophosphokinase n=1 Tax=Psychromonas sp. GE-S-Ul-11 TaxID=3241170 RepID=UPI00390C5824
MTNFKTQFIDLKPKYNRLAENTSLAMKQFLSESKISSFDVEFRVKEQKSFLEKVTRKEVADPFLEIEDIAGVRVICYYKEDLVKIDNIIHEQFDISSVSNKFEELQVDQFGYTSNHYIVTIKKEWLGAPNYRGLDDLKVEIQVRTMLMHTWAAISHKLLYKRNDDVPNQFKRKLNRLSALIELADEQFDDIKNMKIDYQEKLVIEKDIEINADSFLSLMNKHFSDRTYEDDEIPSLLTELRQYSPNIQDFEEKVNKCLPILDRMEEDEAQENQEQEYELPMWGLAGLTRSILDLTSDEYLSKRELPDRVLAITEQYRKAI